MLAAKVTVLTGIVITGRFHLYPNTSERYAEGMPLSLRQLRKVTQMVRHNEHFQLLKCYFPLVDY